MGVISSNTLFHFTSSVDVLLRILETEFQPRYCLEDYRPLVYDGANSLGLEVAVPMVCFCDLPLAQVVEHMGMYGRYGLGMKKEWGVRSGVTPVLYAAENSPAWMALEDVYTVVRNAQLDSSLAPHLPNSIYQLLSYVKPYEGRQLRNGAYTDPLRFYNEREWRYVPSIHRRNQWELPRQEFDDPLLRQEANDRISDQKLHFEPNDIRYIIVANESEIVPLANAVWDIKDRYDEHDKQLLRTRIISAEQIEEDF